MDVDAVAPRPAPGRAGWLVLALLILVQFDLFRQMVMREIAPFVPLACDQASYLTFAYDGYEAMLDRGPFAGLRLSMADNVPAGCLMHVQASYCFLVLGPTRFAALLPHFLYFAAFQVVLVAVLLRWTRRWEAAFFGLGLLLCAGSMLHWQGGLFDFRIDGLAYSLYGIFLGTCLLSDGFASRRWSFAVAGSACLLFLFRHLTLVYVVGIMGLWFAYVLGRLVWVASDRPATKRRLVNTVLAAAVFLAVAGPVVAVRWQALWGYYGVGHLTGGEKGVRAAEAGVFTVADSLLFYGRSVWNLHAGWVFFLVGAVGALLGALLWRRGSGGASAATWVLAGLGLVVPWLALTANTAKSSLVGSVLVPALLWLFLLPVIRSAGAWPAWLLRGLQAVALTACLCCQFSGYCQREPRFAHTPEDRRQILALNDDMAEYACRQGWKTVNVSSDTVLDCLPPYTLGVPAYERKGMRLEVKAALSGSIFTFEDAEGRALVCKSQFVVLRDGPALTNPAFPVSASLARFSPWLREYCQAHLEKLGTYPALGGKFTPYARPSLCPSQGSGDWIISAGLRLVGRSESLRKFPHVQLTGKAVRQLLPREPKAEVLMGGATDRRVIPAKLSFPAADRYVLDFDLPEDLPQSAAGLTEMQVRFNTHFVPRDLGINDDVRELIVYGPSQVELHRRENVGITGNLEKPRPADGE